jgi:hypothetical protein
MQTKSNDISYYEGKSISIRTRVLMFSVLAVLLSARACQQMATLSPLVESFSIVTQFSFALWQNKMAALLVCQKRWQEFKIFLIQMCDNFENVWPGSESCS